jgi:hypothetical protein
LNNEERADQLEQIKRAFARRPTPPSYVPSATADRRNRDFELRKLRVSQIGVRAHAIEEELCQPCHHSSFGAEPTIL